MKRFVLMLALSFALLSTTNVSAENEAYATFGTLDSDSMFTADGLVDTLYLAADVGDSYNETDTSVALALFDYIEQLSIQYMVVCTCGDDSIDYSVSYQGSLDNVNWLEIDSSVARTDESWYLDEVTTLQGADDRGLPPIRYFRAILRARTGMRKAFVNYGVFKYFARGHKPY